MTLVNNLLGAYLKELRAERSLYQIEKDSGIPRSLISRYERGVLTPEYKTLKRFADFYQVDLQALQEHGYEDLFPLGSEQRFSVLQWAQKILKQTS
jgi:transcriptional regulator with XRE-family HTH domain